MILLFFKRMNPFSFSLFCSLFLLFGVVLVMTADFQADFQDSSGPLKAYHAEGFVSDKDLAWFDAKQEALFYTEEDLVRKNEIVWSTLYKRAEQAKDLQTTAEAKKMWNAGEDLAKESHGNFMMLMYVLGGAAIFSLLMIVFGIGNRQHIGREDS